MSSFRQLIPPAVIALMKKDVRRSVAVLCGSPSSLMPVASLVAEEGVEPTTATSTPPPSLLYEVFRQYDDRLILYNDHMVRYEGSFTHMYPSADRKAHLEVVHAGVQELLKAHKNEFPIRQNIKIVSWGPSGDQCVCYYINSSYPPDEWYTAGIRMGLLPNADRGSNPNDKVVQDGLRQRAIAAQASLDAFEVLLAHGGDTDPLVPEGSRSNFILVSGTGDDVAVLSSEDSDILIGITLMAVRRECTRLGIPFKQRKLRLSDVLQAEAIAMLGTSVGVLPIRELVVGAVEAKLLPSDVQSLFTPSNVADTLVLGKPSASNPVIEQLIRAYTSTTF